MGVLRWYWRLQAILQQLMKKPLKAKDQDVELVLLMALFQLMDTRVPDHASVNASVALVKKKKNWAAGLVNAVLRNFIRQQESLLSSSLGNEQADYSHPQWIIDELKKDWPDHWQAILQANNQQAPMILRINQQNVTPENYLSKLGRPAKLVGQAIELEQPSDVSALPGYQEGWFSVQDGGAQKAAPLLKLTSGNRVLDACAAPGGKTCHMLEIEPEINLLAMDVSEKRLQRVEENLQRLEVSAQLIAADAAQPDDCGTSKHSIVFYWMCLAQLRELYVDIQISNFCVERRHRKACCDAA